MSTRRPRAIYIAGPGVFRPDAAAFGERLKRLSAARGCLGLWPLDNGASDAAGIAEANLAMIRRADAVIADLSPFRGVSADAGTVFEVGYAAGLGLPVHAYTTDPRPLAERARLLFGVSDAKRGSVDRDGWEIEDFGLFENLMIPAGLAAPIIVATAPETGFAACLDRAMADV